MFLIDKDVILLNHGSYGATPRPVMEAERGYQDQMESQPVKWFSSLVRPKMAQVRKELAPFVGRNDI